MGSAEDKRKEWWVQFEGLNALLLMHERYGSETSRYFDAYRQQWEFIKRYQVDAKYHGVYEWVEPDGTPRPGPKGEIWKAAYHDGRALLNVSERLKHLEERSAP